MHRNGFRDKAAYSKSMTVDKMKEVAQGRVWTYWLLLLSYQDRCQPCRKILVGIGNTVVGVDRTLQELLQDLASSDEIQARMDGIMFQKLDGVSNSSPFFTLIKDYLSSL
ncbi:hypothetical protein LOK49_LG14G00351 [Camellia lanceoleosa]|uniref:Uncharacterized protein n=1 Tax=Camellia lanceoleosa TaxID=1840588 RepID=A0ACC0FAU4_9ERIC|nr:hypothetical protein LOK49_LG14G00351 [Camellia lanceoleosa]